MTDSNDIQTRPNMLKRLFGRERRPKSPPPSTSSAANEPARSGSVSEQQPQQPGKRTPYIPRHAHRDALLAMPVRHRADIESEAKQRWRRSTCSETGFDSSPYRSPSASIKSKGSASLYNLPGVRSHPCLDRIQEHPMAYWESRSQAESSSSAAVRAGLRQDYFGEDAISTPSVSSNEGTQGLMMAESKRPSHLSRAFTSPAPTQAFGQHSPADRLATLRGPRPQSFYSCHSTSNAKGKEPVVAVRPPTPPTVVPAHSAHSAHFTPVPPQPSGHFVPAVRAIRANSLSESKHSSTESESTDDASRQNSGASTALTAPSVSGDSIAEEGKEERQA